jgi:4-hydroxy-tetrahydrodipicolinate synthase
MSTTSISSIGRSAFKLSGYAPALPTPFAEGGRLDGEAFERVCELQITHGAAALVVCGTTGEAPTLSSAEHGELIRIAVATSRGRVPVVAGAGSNATAHAIELSKDAEENGADAILSVVPYYNKPTQDGLFLHFREIAAATGLPLILYDVPSRTARGLADETVARLAELPRIVGLKDATGEVDRPARLRALVGQNFNLLSGDDASAMGFLAQGGDGCVSITSNAAPGLCRAMFLEWQQGNIARARELMLAVSQLTAALFCETNPAPLKYALALCGLMSAKVRLPLVELNEQAKARVATTLGPLCDEYPDCMIGSIGGAIRDSRWAVAV